MSSVAASLFQVNTRSKFFKSVASGGSAEFAVPDAPSAIITSAPSSSTGTTGMTYRDVGKRVVLVDDDGTHLAVYAQVRKCAGLENPDVDDVLVLVWSLNAPTTVTVVSV